MTLIQSKPNYSKTNSCLSLLLGLALSALATIAIAPAACADQSDNLDFTNADFRAHFFQLCDLVAAKISADKGRDPFFEDSYGVRALCVAYDMTGNTNYLNACRH